MGVHPASFLLLRSSGLNPTCVNKARAVLSSLSSSFAAAIRGGLVAVSSWRFPVAVLFGFFGRWWLRLLGGLPFPPSSSSMGPPPRRFMITLLFFSNATRWRWTTTTTMRLLYSPSCCVLLCIILRNTMYDTAEKWTKSRHVAKFRPTCKYIRRAGVPVQCVELFFISFLTFYCLPLVLKLRDSTNATYNNHVRTSSCFIVRSGCVVRVR